MSTINERIAATLADSSNATSSDLASLIAEVEANLSSSHQTIQAERERMLDPAVAIDAAKVRLNVETMETECARLQTAIPRLQDRMRQIEVAERAARWREALPRVKTERDKLAHEFAELYPKLVAQLIDIRRRMCAMDAEVTAVNNIMPLGERRFMLTTEQTAHEILGVSGPSIFENLRLPDSENPARLIFPKEEPNSLSMAMVEMARIVGSRPAAGPDWATVKKLEDERRLEAAARINAEYERRRAEEKRRYEADLREADEDRRLGHRRERQ